MAVGLLSQAGKERSKRKLRCELQVIVLAADPVGVGASVFRGVVVLVLVLRHGHQSVQNLCVVRKGRDKHPVWLQPRGHVRQDLPGPAFCIPGVMQRKLAAHEVVVRG